MSWAGKYRPAAATVLMLSRSASSSRPCAAAAIFSSVGYRTYLLFPLAYISSCSAVQVAAPKGSHACSIRLP